MERDRHFRINLLHEALLEQQKRRTRVTAQTLREGVERGMGKAYNLKTIRRDLDYMRNRLKLPLRFDAKRRTFHYDGVAHLQGLDVGLLSNADARMLLVARQAAEHFSGTPWHRPLRDLYDRLLAGFPKPLLEEHAGVISRIRFEGPQVQQVKPGIWTTLIQALADEEKLLMVYRSGSGGIDQERQFHPYALVVVDRHWQVVGYDLRRRSIRAFLLTRIQKLETCNATFRRCRDFDLDRYLEDAVSGQPSVGESRRVHLRFTRAASAAGENQIWHRREERWRDDDDRLNVRFRTAALFKVQREVLAWGGQLAVLSPPELRQSMAQAVADLQAGLQVEADQPGLFAGERSPPHSPPGANPARADGGG